jgi:hypothetical protein
MVTSALRSTERPNAEEGKSLLLDSAHLTECPDYS